MEKNTHGFDQVDKICSSDLSPLESNVLAVSKAWRWNKYINMYFIMLLKLYDGCLLIHVYFVNMWMVYPINYFIMECKLSWFNNSSLTFLSLFVSFVAFLSIAGGIFILSEVNISY